MATKLLCPSEYSEDRKRALAEAKIDILKLEEKYNKIMSEVKDMKTEDKKKFADECLTLLKTKQISDSDAKKVLGFAYKSINSQ